MLECQLKTEFKLMGFFTYTKMILGNREMMGKIKQVKKNCRFEKTTVLYQTLLLI